MNTLIENTTTQPEFYTLQQPASLAITHSTPTSPTQVGNLYPKEYTKTRPLTNTIPPSKLIRSLYLLTHRPPQRPYLS